MLTLQRRGLVTPLGLAAAHACHRRAASNSAATISDMEMHVDSLDFDRAKQIYDEYGEYASSRLGWRGAVVDPPMVDVLIDLRLTRFFFLDTGNWPRSLDRVDAA
jgi:hypothetical protein